MRAPKVISKKVKYIGKWLNIVGVNVLVDGKKHYWEYTDGGDGVSVVPVDGKNVYLVKEYRVPLGRYITQIPAGGCYAKNERGRRAQARNELREEVGKDAGKIEKLATVISSGRSTTLFHVYLATGLFDSPKKADDGENVEVIKMPIRKAYKRFLSGELTPSYSLLGLGLAMRRLRI